MLKRYFLFSVISVLFISPKYGIADTDTYTDDPETTEAFEKLIDRNIIVDLPDKSTTATIETKGLEEREITVPEIINWK